VWLALLVAVPMVTGFGNGAPATSCVNLSPTHAGITKQSAATNKYSLSVEEIDGAMNTRKGEMYLVYSTDNT